MDEVLTILHLLFRWMHVVAGIMWIGHLWFFNFVNAQLVKTYDADSKKKVLPELMPRALYWFRWGAMYTFISGALLFAIIYPAGGALLPSESTMNSHLAATLVLVIAFAGFAIYDQLWKNVKNEMVAAAISFVLLVGAAFGMSRFLSGRATWVSMGAILGTIMFANVWMRIWPNQRKIIAGVKGTGPAPDASVAAMAGLRSKHNTYMSMPLMLFMVSNHFPNVVIGSKDSPIVDLGYSNNNIGFIVIGVYILLGWGITKLFYNKSAAEAPKTF